MENFFTLNNDNILEDSSDFVYPIEQMFMTTIQTSSFGDTCMLILQFTCYYHYLLNHKNITLYIKIQFSFNANSSFLGNCNFYDYMYMYMYVVQFGL